MNFTREPIIETVITPREGCKLVVRSSKGSAQQEEYLVDAVEVVSFGRSLFFRSSERPKAFLVPVSDYEVLELKETRMVLKNASPDRSIKIGGGREQQVRPQRESSEEESERSDRKRDKRRRGRRGRDRHEPAPANVPQGFEAEAAQESSQPAEDKMPLEQPSSEERAPSFISKLFPPPPTLIKESLSRYKPAEPGGDILPHLTEEGTPEAIFEPEEIPSLDEIPEPSPEEENPENEE